MCNLLNNENQVNIKPLLVTVHFTKDEIDLLQSVLSCINDKLDWDYAKDNGLISAKILFKHDESIPRRINEVYNKLF
jgi:hypothetical protein